MDKILLQQIVSKATDETKNLTQQIVDLFNFVRDIPYGDIGSRKPEDVYLKNQWTCSWKHELFKEICQFKWVEVKECIVIHRFINLPVKFPEEIKNILNSTDILDPHNLLKVKQRYCQKICHKGCWVLGKNNALYCQCCWKSSIVEKYHSSI